MIRSISLTVLIAAAVSFFLPTSARALEVTVAESASAMIVSRPTSGGSNGCLATFEHNANGDTNTPTGWLYLNIINQVGGRPCGGMIFWLFDLGAYTGRTVMADATVTCGQVWGDPNVHTFRLYESLSNWNEATITWQNMLGAAMTNNPYFTNNVARWLGPELSQFSISGSGIATWSVPSNVVQRWIDDQGSNRGVIIKPDAGGNHMWRTRSARAFPAQMPRITVTLSSNNLKPNTPTNITPVNAAVAQPLSGVVLTASPFSDPNGDAFANSQWQVAAEPLFTTPAWDSGQAAAATNITVPVTLNYSTRYYWRVRYRDDNAESPEWSAWSAPSYFDTSLNLIQQQARVASESAMLWPSFPDSNVNGRAHIWFIPVNPVTNIAPAGALVYWFDLGVFAQYAGLTVDNDADLAVAAAWTQENNPPLMKLHAVLQGWQASNATWNSFVGPDWSTWATKFGTELDAQLIDVQNIVYHWTVPKALIQSWINNPTQNFGIALIPQATGNCQLRTQLSAPAPTLTFDLSTTNAVPPATPSNASPASGAVNQQLYPALQSSAYSGVSPQGAAQWQIAEDDAFTAPLWDNTTTSGLTQVTVASNVLQYSSRYYWRVRHISIDGGKSAYSVPTWFDTEVKAGTFVKRPLEAAMILAAQPTSNFNGSVDSMFWPLPASNNIAGIIMMWFDLSVFAGYETESNAVLSIRNGWVDPNFGAINLVARELLKPWDESTVTWSSYVGGADYTTFFGEEFGSQTLPLEFFGTTSWVISQALIQKWLDSPETNFGISVMPESATANAFIHTRKVAGTAPTLQVSVIPEPAVLALLALACAFLRGRRD